MDIGVRALNNRIFVGIYDDGANTIQVGDQKLYLMDDSMLASFNDGSEKHRGIRPRWGIVLSNDNEIPQFTKVLMDSMKWSRAVTYNDVKLWSIDKDDILMTCDTFTDLEKQKIVELYPLLAGLL